MQSWGGGGVHSRQRLMTEAAAPRELLLRKATTAEQGRGMPANALPREQRTRCLTSGINQHGAKCGCDVHKHGNRG